MTVGPITNEAGSMYVAVDMIRRAESLLNDAANDVARGDIPDAALKMIEAKTQASAGAGIAKVSREVSDYILDILA